METGRPTTVQRGTEILIALGSDEALARDGLGVVRIAEIVGREKSQISRALSALAASGLVERDAESRAYRLGWRLFTLAARSGRPHLVLHAPTILQGLVATTGETAHLSVQQGRQVLTLLSETAPSAISAKGWSGRTVPIVCTSSGRALLLDHGAAALHTLLDGASFDGYCIGAPRDAAELHRRILAARDAGFATVDEEFEQGLVGVAAPVRDFSGRIVAAVNVSGPKFRLGRHMASAANAVQDAALALSRASFSAPRVDA